MDRPEATTTDGRRQVKTLRLGRYIRVSRVGEREIVAKSPTRLRSPAVDRVAVSFRDAVAEDATELL